MRWTNHGGGCCGIMHVSDMNYGPADSNDDHTGRNGRSRECLTRILTHVLPRENNQRVVEVTTSSENDQTENWTEELLAHGFRRVCSFYNSNSGNTVTVWHKHPNLVLYGDAPQPFMPPPPIRPEVRPVLVEYCPNFRANGRGSMFSSAEEVRAEYPLIRQIDRRTVFSDGSVTWEENV